MPIFSADVVAAVLHHMNDDHLDDNLLIARAFGSEDATAATMTTLDQHGGSWSYDAAGATHELMVPWPGGEISERPEIRREVVRLYDAACERLGIQPRPH
ncbi:MAG: DUF2470 domain-containing protein [Actinomycetota bacterium]|nr:DUF2470 domain-containing protein [Actinomycetota bacterium]